MTAAYSDEYFEVVIEPSLAIVRVRRLGRRFESVSAVRRSTEAMMPVLRGLSMSRRYTGLLYDSRSAPPSNLPEIEAELIATTKQMLTLFPQVAMLLRTAQSALQVRRLLASLGQPGSAFHHEDEALATLAAKRSQL